MAAAVRRWLAPAPLTALAVAVLAVLPALLVPGILATRAGGDSPFLLQRVQQMAVTLAAGHVPPRWMPDGAYGLGYPFWNFYAPLVYLYAGLVALLGGGVVGAIKVAVLACFLAAAAGMYRLGERLWGSAGAALVASAAYTLAPYHLVNLYVRGDALAELAAYAVFPWLLVAIDHARRRRSAGSIAGVAVACAALALAHNVSAVLFVPVALLFLVWPRERGPGASRLAGSEHDPRGRPPGPEPVDWARVPWARRPAAWTLAALDWVEWRAWRRWRSLRGRGLLAAVAGLALGLALAAWFWVPALAERGQVQLAANTTGYFNYAGHFRGLDAVDVRPVFDYTVNAGRQPWRVGLAQLALAALGTVLAWRRGRRREAGLWLVVGFGALVMITPLSRPLWAALPLLPFVQFPWRWLSVVAFATSLLAAPVGAGRWWRAALAVAVLALATLPGLTVETLSVRAVDRADIQSFEVFSNNLGTTVRSEYLPTAVQPRPASSVDVVQGREGVPRAQAGIASVTLLRSGPTFQEWQVDVAGDQPATVAFPTLWFPGWLATLQREPRAAPVLGAGPDGKPIPTPAAQPDQARTVTRATGVVPGSGWQRLELAPGRYLLRLDLGRSDVRAMAEGLSLAALLLVLALLLVNRRRDWRALAAWLLVGLIGSVLLARLLPVGADRGPVTQDRVRSAWPHANPAGLYFGEAHLTGAHPSAETVAAGQDLGVDLSWAAAPEEYAVDLALVSPAEPVYGVPDIRAQAEGNLVEGDDRLTLAVPADATDGLYYVRMRVRSGDKVLPAESADGFSLASLLRREPVRFQLGDVYLGPVRVRSTDTGGAVTATPLARMGDVSLLKVATEQEGRRLRVDMTWQADKLQAVEYKTSVRLLNAAGKVVAQDDQLPLYGYFPATAWPAGQPWDDRRWLDLPDGLAPGNGYTAEVVLYTELPAQELGSARVPGVAISAQPPTPSPSPHPVKGTD
jgi:hypothetical protein